jgi:transposase
MGPFPPAPGGGEKINHGYKGKGVTLHMLTDFFGNPLALSTTPANGNERLQVEKLIEMTNIMPTKKMIILQADKGYDCYWLRDQLIKKNIFPYIPYRKNNNNSKSYKTTFQIKSVRWKVERTFAWIKRKCRRLLMRWERINLIWKAFVVLAGIFMWIENLLG